MSLITCISQRILYIRIYTDRHIDNTDKQLTIKNYTHLRAQKLVVMVIPLSKFTVLSCGDHTFSLDTKTTWST